MLRQTSQQLTDTKLLRCGDLKPPCVRGLVYVSEEPKHASLKPRGFGTILCVFGNFFCKIHTDSTIEAEVLLRFKPPNWFCNLHSKLVSYIHLPCPLEPCVCYLLQLQLRIILPESAFYSVFFSSFSLFCKIKKCTCIFRLVP